MCLLYENSIKLLLKGDSSLNGPGHLLMLGANHLLRVIEVGFQLYGQLKKSLVTNFIQSYLHQIFDDSHGLKASLKPLRRPFDRYQSRLEAINNGQDIKQINW